MAFADMLIALPSIIIALVVLGFINNSSRFMFGLDDWVVRRYLRYFRNLARDVQTQPFVKFASLSGLTRTQTIVHHIIHILCVT